MTGDGKPVRTTAAVVPKGVNAKFAECVEELERANALITQAEQARDKALADLAEMRRGHDADHALCLAAEQERDRAVTEAVGLRRLNQQLVTAADQASENGRETARELRECREAARLCQDGLAKLTERSRQELADASDARDAAEEAVTAFRAFAAGLRGDRDTARARVANAALEVRNAAPLSGRKRAALLRHAECKGRAEALDRAARMLP